MENHKKEETISGKGCVMSDVCVADQRERLSCLSYAETFMVATKTLSANTAPTLPRRVVCLPLVFISLVFILSKKLLTPYLITLSLYGLLTHFQY